MAVRSRLRINQPPNEDTNLLEWLNATFQDIYSYIISIANANDLVGITLRSNFFAHGAGGLSFRPVENINYEDIWNLISCLTQSNEDFQINNSFIVEVTYVNIPIGSKKDLTLNSIAQRSMVSIVNNDNMCLPRALIVGQVYIELQKNKTNQEMKDRWAKIRDGRRKFQREAAENLVRNANVVIPAQGCGFNEIQQFQSYYERSGIAIVVYDKYSFGSGEPPFFDGRSEAECLGVINLSYDERARHFDTILNLIGASKSENFCSYCNKRFKYIEDHRCKKYCPNCFSTPVCESENYVKCTDCNRNFKSNSCLLNHKKDKSYKTKRVCDVLKICDTCCKVVNLSRGKHECGMNYCKLCKSKHQVNESCYIQPIREIPKTTEKKHLFMFYDFETRQDTAYQNHQTTKVHIPNLCVVQQVCTDCIEIDNISVFCNTCGCREYVFRDNPVKQFVDLSCRAETEFEQIICIAHNARGFDAQFILKELVDRTEQFLPSVILSGQSIITLQINKTKFIDSLNYFHMKLSALPKAFDLPESNKKGYFPHLFNTNENQTYVGLLPDIDFYSPDTMSQKDREDFLIWYDDNKNSVFDFQKEIVEYCRMDVEILRRACIAFRKIFFNIGDTDPFVVSCTIASACSYVFRKKFLKKETIGIIPPGGYRRADKHSQKSIEWLLQCEREIGKEITHAARGREVKLLEGPLVDGFLIDIARNQKGIVFEYQGCFWHGCPKCYKNNRNKKIIKNAFTFDEVYENTRTKIEKIKSFGYEVVEMWECEFDRIKLENPDIDNYVKNHPLMDKVTLNPRDAFYGGRTENIVTCYEIKENEKIKYTDICSLYPYICKKGKFPLGHPRIYVSHQCLELTGDDLNNLSLVEGLVKCRILPPRDLFLPLLPIKMHGRLLFALCRTCCEEMRQTDCNHEQEHEREFTGTWVADELKKAIELGYRITEIFIIWQYEMTCFNPQNNTGGLFVDYINAFLKIKQQASGWPVECIDDSCKAKYLYEYERDEGIKLDSNKIEKNSGLRSVAKLCLNSFWGKFGQRSNLKQTKIIKTRESLLELLSNPEKEVNSVLFANDNVLYANWQYKQEAVESSPITNVVIAAFVTAQARLKLYDYLENLGERILYYDTDSCIFVTRDNVNEYTPSLGTLLGDMTDELQCYGVDSYIKKFVSGGPKFYAYEVFTPSTNNTNTCCKVKGITLNYINSLKINFDTISKMIIDDFNDYERDSRIELNFRAIKRTNLHEIVTRDETKTCKVVLKKRRYVSHLRSLPFGYKS